MGTICPVFAHLRSSFLLCALVTGAVVAFPDSAPATVTSSTRTITYSPSVNTTSFAVPFAFTNANQLLVVKITEATEAETTLVRGTDYSVRMPADATQGSITTVVAVGSTHSLRITRVMPLTQATDLSAFNNYSGTRAETVADTLLMQIQQVAAEISDSEESVDEGIAAHVGQSDPHTQYVLENGASGGQTVIGGTASGNGLTLRSTSHATKGKIFLGSGSTELVVDDVNNRVGVGTASPTVELEVSGTVLATTAQAATVQGSTSSGGDMTLSSTSNGTKGNIHLGSGSTYDEANTRLGIGETSPAHTLEVIGDAVFDTSSEDGDYRLLIDRTSGDSVVQLQSDETDSVMYVQHSDDAGTSAGAAALLNYGPSHATRPGYVGFQAEGTIHGLLSNDGFSLTTAPFRGRKHVATADAAETLAVLIDDNDCNSVFFADTDNTVLSLPDISDNALGGCEFTLKNTCADGGCLISVSPDSDDSLEGSCVGVTGAGSATVVELSGTADKDAQNTKSTANKGDWIRCIADESVDWWCECVGEWVSES